jgi:transglutaminase-like putative cysteine protease
VEFEVTHLTTYQYGQPAAEAYGEARLTPPELPTQHVKSHSLSITPATRTSGYTDHFGNAVQFFSLPFRHDRLEVCNRAVVETQTLPRPNENLDLSIQEARQIFSSAMTDVFDYLQPTEIVTIGRDGAQWARKYLRGDTSVAEGLQNLNTAIGQTFVYRKGSTENSTPLATIWKDKQGVCQDFAHIGLSVLRTAGLPCRYVCGYIEAGLPGDGALRGAMATHAWIEVLLPGMIWIALDPTNRQWCDERYVAVSFGRDYRDATPIRGRFKGSGGQKMEVNVLMKRRTQ